MGNNIYNIPYFVYTSGEKGTNGLDWGIKFSSPFCQDLYTLDREYSKQVGIFGFEPSLVRPSQNALLVLSWPTGSILVAIIFPYFDSQANRENISLVGMLIPPALINEGYKLPEVLSRIIAQNQIEYIAKRKEDIPDNFSRPETLRLDLQTPEIVDLKNIFKFELSDLNWLSNPNYCLWGKDDTLEKKYKIETNILTNTVTPNFSQKNLPLVAKNKIILILVVSFICIILFICNFIKIFQISSEPQITNKPESSIGENINDMKEKMKAEWVKKIWREYGNGSKKIIAIAVANSINKNSFSINSDKTELLENTVRIPDAFISKKFINKFDFLCDDDDSISTLIVEVMNQMKTDGSLIKYEANDFLIYKQNKKPEDKIRLVLESNSQFKKLDQMKETQLTKSIDSFIDSLNIDSLKEIINEFKANKESVSTFKCNNTELIIFTENKSSNNIKYVYEIQRLKNGIFYSGGEIILPYKTPYRFPNISDNGKDIFIKKKDDNTYWLGKVDMDKDIDKAIKCFANKYSKAVKKVSLDIWQ